MTSARRLTVACLTVIVGLGLVACGSNDKGKDSAAAAAVSQSFLQSPWYSELTSTQTGCIGTGVINDFGIESATKYGFLATGNRPVTLKPIVLSAKDAATFADTFTSCTDAAATVRAGAVQSISIADSLPSTGDAQQKLVSCVDAHLSSAIVRSALTAGFEGKSNAGALQPVWAACSSTYDPASTAVAQGFLDGSGSTFTLTTSQASCLGTGVIRELGAAKAVRYGLLGKGNQPVKVGAITMPAKDAATLADITIACTDPATTFKNELLAQVKNPSDQTKAAIGACLTQHLTHALLRKTLIAAYSGDQKNNNLGVLFNSCNGG